MTAAATIKQLQNNMRLLRGMARKRLSQPSEHAALQALRDNLPLLERESRYARGELRSLVGISHKESNALTAVCERAASCQNKSIQAALDIALYAQSTTFTTAGLSALPCRLIAWYVEMAANGAKQENAEIIGGAIAGLYRLKDLDMDLIFEKHSAIEQVFRQDPTGEYNRMDRQTKAHYRMLCARQAAAGRYDEAQTARAILTQAKAQNCHIGAVLFAADVVRKRRKLQGGLLIALRILLPVAASQWLGWLFHLWWLGGLLYIPLHEIIRPLLERVFTLRVPPYFMPRMDLAQTVPENCKTLITVSALLPNAAHAAQMGAHLERLWLANNNGSIAVCLLADYCESPLPQQKSDAADRQAMEEQIKRLNARYHGRFLLALRPRRYSATQQAYAGWERKRGAISQLICAIRGDIDGFETIIDPNGFLTGTRYLMALDQDTQLPFNSVYELVCAAAHPLNRPTVDENKRIVTAGFGILTPAVADRTGDAGKTLFSRLFSGIGGVSSYNTFCSHHDQDLLGTAVFTGKGLIDVAAYDQCVQNTMPPERVLSHDIIEGALLRCGYVSDVTVTDGCPVTANAWNKRRHRWIRGDFQNTLWLLPRLQTGSGRQKNPLSFLDRLRVNDNLLRALTAPAALLLLAAAAALPQVRLLCAVVALLGLTAGELLAAGEHLLRYGVYALRQEYYSPLFPVALQHVFRSLLHVVFLVTDASVSVSGACKGLWRQWISHKNRLEWATADQVDFLRKDGLPATLARGWLSLVAGLAGLLWAPPSFRLFALLFLAGPFVQWYISRRSKQVNKPVLSASDTAYLRDLAHKMWQYYADLCNAENNYLPPDNLQLQPVQTTAHRTSPTNIGLMLLSTVSAEALRIISAGEMLNRIAAAWQTIEQLERWHGHLLNWYDTRTRQPLKPRYCSTVDSGNFACCAFAVANRLRTLPDRQAALLAKKMDAFLQEIDFTALYNDHRRLFRIGYDLETETPSNAYYDMLMSESRMTGYFAIGTRQIPKQHWGSLSRLLTRSGLVVGPLSWTGTVFEYLMPTLLLPSRKGTLGFEAARFCIACHQRADGGKRPWGRSESGYYDFDEQLNYQYKPHGVAKIALKRYDPKEIVIAPYASFLALPFTPHAALDNIRHLDRLGAFGRYGAMEALDYTKSRCRHTDFERVNSFMAHHVGMSLCAVCNTLCQNALQNLFMQGAMVGPSVLLEESVPTGCSIYRPRVEKIIPEKHRLPVRKLPAWHSPTPLAPQATLFVNEAMTVLADATGQVKSQYRGRLLYTTPPDVLDRPGGFWAFFGEEHDLHSMTALPHYPPGGTYNAVPGKNVVKYTARNGVLTGEMHFSLCRQVNGELRTFRINNPSSHTVRCRLTVYFEPVMANEDAFRAHPAFSRLFITAKQSADSRMVMFCKRPREKEEPLYMAAGFETHSPTVTAQCNSEQALQQRAGHFRFAAPEKSMPGALPAPCCCMNMLFTLAPKQTLNTRFAIAVGPTAHDAENQFHAAFKEPPCDSPLAANTLESRLAGRLLPYIWQDLRLADRLPPSDFHPQSLWQLGLSGERPVVTMPIANPAEADLIKPYLDAHSLMRRCGISFDFCLLYNEQGEYDRPVYGHIITIINHCGMAKRIGHSGGIHLINAAVHPQAESVLQFVSRVMLPINESKLREPRSFSGIRLFAAKPGKTGLTPTLPVEGGYFANGRFVVTKTPPVPWTHTLANERFGSQLSSRSLGFTFAENARENRLTPWSNNVITDHTGERLILKLNHQYYDLIDGATAVFAPNSVCYHGQVANLSYRVTVTVAAMQKRIAVHFSVPPPPEAEIAYFTRPAMAFDRQHAAMLTGQADTHCAVVWQPSATAFRGCMAMGCSKAARTCFDQSLFWSGNWHETGSLPTAQSCLALITGAERSLTFTLAYGPTVADARRQALSPAQDAVVSPFSGNIQLHSSQPALDEMINTFLPHQVLVDRLYSRTGFYQCSGAFGFRDQLQDVDNLMLLAPAIAREQIRLCCRRQFEQGDVMHWWHEMPAGPAGVRTRCSDDALWLPLAIARYVNNTGEIGLLHVQEPFLTGPLLAKNQAELYLTQTGTAPPASVYEHGKRAIDRLQCSKRGLCLIGSCDWNDGFSCVGVGGAGESVWLTQFAAIVCRRYASVAVAMSDSAYANALKQRADDLLRAVDLYAWDADHYTRAYFDDGRVIGANGNPENAIDLLPQAFAVFSQPASSRAQTAIETACRRLVDHGNKVIRLFHPPFQTVNAGYISSYPPGLRENGGQYNHGVLWLVMALLRLRQPEHAYQLLRYINPADICSGAEAKRYKTEPYAVAGDIYTHPDVTGRGGWTHYTGAAGWMYRITVEEMLGVTRRGDRLTVAPNLPPDLYECDYTVTIGHTTVQVQVRLHGPCNRSESVPLDGKTHLLRFYN